MSASSQADPNHPFQWLVSTVVLVCGDGTNLGPREADDYQPMSMCLSLWDHFLQTLGPIVPDWPVSGAWICNPAGTHGRCLYAGTSARRTRAFATMLVHECIGMSEGHHAAQQRVWGLDLGSQAAMIMGKMSGEMLDQLASNCILRFARLIEFIFPGVRVDLGHRVSLSSVR